MPFVSKAQNAWGHTPEGEKALGGPAAVKEWEGATNYSNLPERTMNKGFRGKTTRYAEGGEVLGRTKDFLKQGDGEDQNLVKAKDRIYKNPDLAEQEYGKGTSPAHLDDVPNRRKGSKVLKTIKPRG